MQKNLNNKTLTLKNWANLNYFIRSCRTVWSSNNDHTHKFIRCAYYWK